MDWYLRNGGAIRLEQLTVHRVSRQSAATEVGQVPLDFGGGCFETLKAFANWVA